MNSVLTTLRIFEEVAGNQPAGLSDLARRLNIPKSTVQRSLKTLQQAGWVRSTADGHWEITGLAFRLGSTVAARHNLRDIALPELSALQAATGETVHLAVPDGAELVLIERLDSSHQLRAFLPLGTRLPLHAAATGKAYLATLPDARIADHLARTPAQTTAHTITDTEKLWDEIHLIRERGYATTVDGLHEGISAVAVALRGSPGPARACFSISGPSSRLTPGHFDSYAARALATRDTIERLLPA
ncbi:IclR family transcriptional regulator [Nocardia panacis]|uniref:IclR family transcriptional regulator n=1 Tax=Nocardia panacis TaxID=2340916 RepID=A0A3A4K1Q2_9NOCA|nr:IclR family transcriptional regulator [Nocardia panacis]RJO73680.1 IclR family transcriptional regulator [Nocardia panacis]